MYPFENFDGPSPARGLSLDRCRKPSSLIPGGLAQLDSDSNPTKNIGISNMTSVRDARLYISQIILDHWVLDDTNAAPQFYMVIDYLSSDYRPRGRVIDGITKMSRQRLGNSFFLAKSSTFATFGSQLNTRAVIFYSSG